MHSDDALAIMLPQVGALPQAGETARAHAAHWWRIVDGRVIDHGDDWARTGIPHSLTVASHVIGLAPVADVALHPVALPALAPKQALAAARHAIAERSIAPLDTLHAVPVMATDGDGDGGIGTVAVASRAAMAAWTGWAADHGLALHSLVPAALLVPLPDGSDAAHAMIGGEAIVRTRDTAFPADDALIEAMLPPGAAIHTVTPESLDAAIIRACDDPPGELLQGPYAPRGASVLTRGVLSRAARLLALILIVSLAILVVQLFRIHRDTQALDEAAATEAATVLGGSAPPADQLVARLDTRIAELGGEGGRVTAPLAALVAAIEPQPTVTADTLAWQGNGVLSATIGAPQAQDINAVLLALQAAGWRITATARSGTDGRQLADITIRSGP